MPRNGLQRFEIDVQFSVSCGELRINFAFFILSNDKSFQIKHFRVIKNVILYIFSRYAKFF